MDAAEDSFVVGLLYVGLVFFPTSSIVVRSEGEYLFTRLYVFISYL